jgi:hypothetical protein
MIKGLKTILEENINKEKNLGQSNKISDKKLEKDESIVLKNDNFIVLS